MFNVDIAVPEAPNAADDVANIESYTYVYHARMAERLNPTFIVFTIILSDVRFVIVIFATVRPSNCEPSINRLFVPF